MSTIDSTTDDNIECSCSKHCEDDDIFTINIHKLRAAIVSLSDNPNIEIDNLTYGSKLYKDHELVKFMVESLYGTEQYRIIEDMITDQHWPSIVKPGTIGSFLFGCFQSTYGDVGKMCSPLCISNILPYSIDEYSQCDHQTWIQSDSDTQNRFKLLNEGVNDNIHKAYIFVEEDFEGFYLPEIKYLRSRNIRIAQLMNTKNSRHYALSRMVPMSELPIHIKKPESYKYKSKVQGRTKKHENVTDYNYFWGILLVIIILLVLVLVK